jgi:hypothetical protein
MVDEGEHTCTAFILEKFHSGIHKSPAYQDLINLTKEATVLAVVML